MYEVLFCRFAAGADAENRRQRLGPECLSTDDVSISTQSTHTKRQMVVVKKQSIYFVCIYGDKVCESTLRSRTPNLSRPAQHRKMTKAEMARAMVAKNDFLVNKKKQRTWDEKNLRIFGRAVPASVENIPHSCFHSMTNANPSAHNSTKV